MTSIKTSISGSFLAALLSKKKKKNPKFLAAELDLA
jgi:hypothetical protein